MNYNRRGPGRLETSSDVIDGWVISEDGSSCSQQGHVLKIVPEQMPARLGGKPLPAGTPNLKPRFGALYKPAYTEYVLLLDGVMIFQGSSSGCTNIMYEYFQRRRVVPGMTLLPKNEKAGPYYDGKGRAGTMSGLAMLMAFETINELAKQDPREFAQESQIPEEFADRYLTPPAETPNESEAPF